MRPLALMPNPLSTASFSKSSRTSLAVVAPSMTPRVSGGGDINVGGNMGGSVTMGGGSGGSVNMGGGSGGRPCQWVTITEVNP